MNSTRRQAIMEMLLAQGRLSVETLVKHFDVTGMTIRRDLDALEQQGFITRTHGGCVPKSPQVSELPFREKERYQNEEKQAIARMVVSNISDGITLYLDTGTTCVHTARLLRTHRKNLRVLTNNLPAALELFDADTIEVVVPGGILGRRSPDLTGLYSTDRFRDWRFDLAVVGADAIDTKAGEFYSAEGPTAALSRQAQARAAHIFVCADHTKFGKHASAVAGYLEDGVSLCTDHHVPTAWVRQAERHGAHVLVANLQNPGDSPRKHPKGRNI